MRNLVKVALELADGLEDFVEVLVANEPDDAGVVARVEARQQSKPIKRYVRKVGDKHKYVQDQHDHESEITGRVRLQIRSIGSVFQINST